MMRHVRSNATVLCRNDVVPDGALIYSAAKAFMAADSWEEIEELFFRGLQASDTVRRKLLSEVSDPHIVAAVTQLWTNASDAPSGFLGDLRAKEAAAPYKVNDVVERRFRLDTLLGT